MEKRHPGEQGVNAIVAPRNEPNVQCYCAFCRRRETVGLLVFSQWTEGATQVRNVWLVGGGGGGAQALGFKLNLCSGSLPSPDTPLHTAHPSGQTRPGCRRTNVELKNGSHLKKPETPSFAAATAASQLCFVRHMVHRKNRVRSSNRLQTTWSQIRL
jgi:hypothetical protein